MTIHGFSNLIPVQWDQDDIPTVIAVAILALGLFGGMVCILRRMPNAEQRMPLLPLHYIPPRMRLGHALIYLLEPR